jgi:tRNA threonylcarbamoyladenosine biosynthesis protein TsaE
MQFVDPFSLPVQYHCRSEIETIALGIEIGKQLSTNAIVCFFGDLGAGKTTFIKGLVQGVSENFQDVVSSPTFTYLNIYQGTQTVYHFDLYRLRDADEFLSMGFDEFFFADGICCIEWSERIAVLLTMPCIRVSMEHLGANERLIVID